MALCNVINNTLLSSLSTPSISATSATSSRKADRDASSPSSSRSCSKLTTLEINSSIFCRRSSASSSSDSSISFVYCVVSITSVIKSSRVPCCSFVRNIMIIRAKLRSFSPAFPIDVISSILCMASKKLIPIWSAKSCTLFTLAAPIPLRGTLMILFTARSSFPLSIVFR